MTTKENATPENAQFPTDGASDSEQGVCPLCGVGREYGPSRFRIELHDSAESSIGYTETRLCADCWDILYHDILDGAGGASA